MELRGKVKELLKELISINSVSGKERNIQEFIQDWLSRRGVELERQLVEGDRFNLIYRGKRPLLISCHVDTVPPLGMKDAFKPKEVGGRIHGRGASDVKGALASLLTAVDIFKSRYPNEEVPLCLAFVVDEENNSALGSEHVPRALKGIESCLVLEPTYGVLCTSQLGSFEFSIRVEGESVHSAEFETTDNPVRVCMDIIDSIEEKLKRKVNVIHIRGGSKHYVVPRRCDALLEVKLYEGERAKDVEDKVKESLKSLRTSCRIDMKVEDAEEFIRFKDGRLREVALEVLREVDGREPKVGVMPSWTDAANYHRMGYSCLVFGYGSLRDSHTDRESIGEEELQKMTLFLLGILERFR